jgi:hypothetical protein
MTKVRFLYHTERELKTTHVAIVLQ